MSDFQWKKANVFLGILLSKDFLRRRESQHEMKLFTFRQLRRWRFLRERFSCESCFSFNFSVSTGSEKFYLVLFCYFKLLQFFSEFCRFSRRVKQMTMMYHDSGCQLTILSSSHYIFLVKQILCHRKSFCFTWRVFLSGFSCLKMYINSNYIY